MPRIPPSKPSVDEILRKHGARIESQFKTSNTGNIDYSREYLRFKEEKSPELTRYESMCNSAGNILKLKVSKKDEDKIRKSFDIAHIEAEPWQALSLSVMVFLGVFFIGIFSSIAIAMIKGGITEFPLLFFMLVTITSIFLFYYINDYPTRIANRWRLKASSQMVPAILYIVVYMRHTSNLEKAIEFASEHLQAPLSLDFKKIFYDVALGKYSTIKESLDGYLERWRDYSIEFIESFHLIESSLFEPEEARRISTLEKSLQVVLDGVYDKMLKFTHDVKAPLTNVYMLAIMLPILGIALIPLASAMLNGMIKWTHIIILYNIIIPFLAFFMMDKIMVLRPGGYGETSYLEKNPLYPQYKNKGAFFAAFLICFPLFLIGISPLIFQFTNFPGLLGLTKDFTFGDLGLGFSALANEPFFDFKTTSNGIVGPFGAGALFLSLLIPLSIALFFAIAYKDRTSLIIKERDKTKQLELEFNNSLFQLGNRLGDGIPPELVFAKVSESTKGLVSGEFFRRVDYNIRNLGMSVEKAIFDARKGALIFYPSDLIATSMRILVEASKKGLKIAAISLISISEYVKNLQKITERLKDLLAEISSEMKSNMTFLAPLLSGIVVGLALMITAILNKLNLASLSGESIEGIGNIQNIVDIFQVQNMIPPYYLQIAIGVYLIQMIFILTRTLVTIDSGEDKLEETYKIGSNLKTGMLFYFFTSLLATVILFVLSSVVLGGVVS
jgi:Flp pilus assembly protein TadB